MNKDADKFATELARRVPKLAELCPEQIICAEADSDAGLVDQWGRVHGVSAATTIGRDPGRAGVAILEASVSRAHAALRRGPAGWTVADLGSTNGTRLEGTRVDAQVPLGDRQLLIIGDVGFIFVEDVDTLERVAPDEALRAITTRGGATELLRLLAPASGSGGVVEYGGASAQLGSTQFALVQLLAERYLAEKDRPAKVRGFVRTIEIVASLPWDTSRPEDAHVKQLVRRVRRALEKLPLGETIESQHGFGYRLVVEPKIVSE